VGLTLLVVSEAPAVLLTQQVLRVPAGLIRPAALVVPVVLIRRM
jgi:hypothetical protein